MPRNVVTLEPRLDFFGRKRKAQERLLSAIEERYRVRKVENSVRIDFPKRVGKQGKAQVVAELDRIDPNWRRVLRIYPRD